MKYLKNPARLRYLVPAILILILSGCGSSEKEKVFEQAESDMEQGSYSYALAGYEASVANGTNEALSWRGIGLCHLRLGEPETAVSDLTMALSYEDNSRTLQKDILTYRAQANIKAGRMEEALSDCQTLTGMGEADADVYFLTGEAALGLDSYEEAMTNFEQSLQADPSYDRAIQIYGVYVENGMEADGSRFLEKILSVPAKTAQEHCDRGRVCYYMEDYDQAWSELIEAQKGGVPEAASLLGMVYMAREDYSNARAMFTQYNSRSENSAKGYNGLALCDMAEKNYAAALSDIQQGIAVASPDDLQSLMYNEVVIYERMLDFPTALAKAQEYMEIFPDDTRMEREVTFLRSRVQS